LNTIRKASNKGLALGTDRFKQEIEALSGRVKKRAEEGGSFQKSEVFTLTPNMVVLEALVFRRFIPKQV